MEEIRGVPIGRGNTDRYLYLRYANRHGLVAGATGTGKTVTLQVLAEGFSAEGVPVFMADVKGDLSGISREGTDKPKLKERARQVGMGDLIYRGFPTVFWDLFGEKGHRVRATVSDMGPLLLSRLMDLNETQEGVLNVAFAAADDEGLLLLDFKDLSAMLTYTAENAKALSRRYGLVSSASIGAIQRRMLMLERDGVEHILGEPALDIRDFMRTDPHGMGYINVLAADRLMESPRLYSTFMTWLLAELFEELPEVGDPEKPRLVFFFDEAHLLFDDAPDALVDKVEQVARLIRSKGVGLYLISQNPLDIPDRVLGQLGNRVQHALRAYTPKEQKAVRASVQAFRPNPALDVERTITELGVGEALVSTLEGSGIPSMVERVLIRPPCSRIGGATPEEREAVIRTSPMAGKYDDDFDRESAYEKLTARAETKRIEEQRRSEEDRPRGRSAPRGRGIADVLMGDGRRQGLFEAAAKSAARTVGRSIGRQILRGIFGSLLKGR